jgi:hypothetical protein
MLKNAKKPTPASGTGASNNNANRTQQPSPRSLPVSHTEPSLLSDDSLSDFQDLEASSKKAKGSRLTVSVLPPIYKS